MVAGPLVGQALRGKCLHLDHARLEEPNRISYPESKRSVGRPTVNSGVTLALPLVHQRLNELSGLELDLADCILRVELPDLVAHVEHVHAALLDARALRRDLADLQERCRASADLRGADAKKAAGVVRRGLGYVVEA